jgi:hypothetical protein
MAADYIRVRVTGKGPLKKYITGGEISLIRHLLSMDEL